MGIPGGEEKEKEKKGRKKENFPTLETKTDVRIHEAQKTPNKLN